ncbi:MAG TPA: alpha/beta fold hydrolase [Burkholderiaceae bacterium]|nr:alpha/beta fold hydrolase [Burkholderiaceae bacterium]
MPTTTATAAETPAPQPASAAALIDPLAHAAQARLLGSMSLASSMLAFTDWFIHLAVSPGKRLDLAHLALQQWQQWARYALRCAASDDVQPRCVEPAPNDPRFAAPQWQRWPFNVFHQAFLTSESWWAAATRDVWAVEPHHLQKVAFSARQWLDMLSPGNFLPTNPLVIERTSEEKGLNLLRGAAYALEDFQRELTEAPPAGAERFVVGRDMASTAGTVVMRNRLAELIQYAPRTKRVHAEPVLIVPAWIMKYYILDLQPGASLIEYLVERGHTVFCLSWLNPLKSDRDLGLDDYLQLGPMAALRAIGEIAPGARVHAAGYCLGGTLLAVAAAAMARDRDARLASMTLMAAQTDFTEPGELSLFIDEAQVGLLEAQMARTGYLTARQMAAAFQMLRSYDLLWSRMVNEYLLGQRRQVSALMAWNADATRMPARMHSQYLRRMFLHNDLAEGRYLVDGRPIALNTLRLPLFVLGAVRDHVAPWRSVFRLHQLCNAELTFVLASGGHNVGIVSPPGQSGRSYRMLTRPRDAPGLTPDQWLSAAPSSEGSWWPAWQHWLHDHSGAQVAPPSPSRSLGAAPGQYVLRR